MRTSDKLFRLAPARRFEKDSRKFPELHYALRGSTMITIRHTGADIQSYRYVLGITAPLFRLGTSAEKNFWCFFNWLSGA